MENILKELEIIEAEHKEYFEKTKIKLYQYINVGKKPVMIRFNKDLDSKQRLPNEIFEKVDKFIKSFYGTIH
jgi:hypothetical protein